MVDTFVDYSSKKQLYKWGFVYNLITVLEFDFSQP